MKIGVWHNLPSGGAKRALHQHVRGLTERGHVVETWTLDTADRRYLPLTEFGPEHVLPFPLREGRWSGNVRRLVDQLATPARARRMHAACARAAREMQQRGVDVVFAASCRMFAVPFIGRHTRLPSVAYIQEPARWLYEAPFGRALPWVSAPSGESRAARVGRRAVRGILAHRAAEEWRAVHAFGRVLVNSRYSRESFLRAYGVDARLCYLGVDAAAFTPSPEPRGTYVIGLGTLNAPKGADLAIRAIARLPEPRPTLVWVGNMADPAYLSQLTALAAAEHVTFDARVQVSDATLTTLLGQAAAMIYTSHLEPFGLAPLEAGACETPVVAVAEGGVRETIVDGVNGRLADDRDPASLADALAQVLGDPARARAMGRRGRELVLDRWTVDASVACVERHLQAAVEERHRSGAPT